MAEIQSDLLDQVIMIPNAEQELDRFGRVRAIYVEEKTVQEGGVRVTTSRLRLVVLLTSGRLADIPADYALCKRETL